MIKKIGILTSGGDAPGMNAAIRSVVRSGLYYGMEVYGIQDGYKGLIEEKIVQMDRSSVSDIVNRGGTILKTARLPEFKEEGVRMRAVEILRKWEIEALVVLGGDGSFKGAKKLSDMGIRCVGIPCTIDNDIASTDYTIGFDTCLNTIIESVDRIRDTTESHSRCSIIEVMGNHCGDLALFSGIAEGAELIITPDRKTEKEDIILSLRKMVETDVNRRAIIIVSENIYPDIRSLAKTIEKETGMETRASVLGYVQRGGSPSAFDRILGARLGAFAVQKLVEGKGGISVGIKDNSLVYYDIDQALSIERKSHEGMMGLIDKINK